MGSEQAGGCVGQITRAGSTAATVVVAPESDDDDEQAREPLANLDSSRCANGCLVTLNKLTTLIDPTLTMLIILHYE